MTNVWSAMEDPQHPHPPRRRVEFTGAAGDGSFVDPHWVELSELVSRAEANRAEMSRLQAERAEICADALDLVALRVAQRQAERPGRRGNEPMGDTIPLREVLAELSAALRVGERTISSWLGDGAALVGTYPATLQALREGRIDERYASAIIDAGLPLSAEHRAEYEALILPVAKTDTAPGTRVMARVIAARLQPDIVEQNQRRALAERRVRAFDLDDGLSRLLLDGPAALIHGIYDRLTQMGTAQGELDAGAPTADGDTGLGAIRATVQVTIPILTLAGLDDDPALLDGESPIDADTARALAASAPCWQRVMTHPVTAEPLRLDTYRPSKRLRRLLHTRDQHCRWPGCRRRAQKCDTDHTIAWEEGGPTCVGNLEMLCKRHHTLKHTSLWRVIQLGGGTLEFISPTRRKYRNNAPPIVASVAARPNWARYLDATIDPTDPPTF